MWVGPLVLGGEVPAASGSSGGAATPSLLLPAGRGWHLEEGPEHQRVSAHAAMGKVVPQQMREPSRPSPSYRRPHSYGASGFPSVPYPHNRCAFSGSGAGRPYGPKYGTGDVVGALYDKAARTISYYKNGEALGPAFRDVNETSALYPCIGLRTR